MKFVYYNDTNKFVSIHPATLTHGCDVDMSKITPLEERVFLLPEGTYPWVKMWDYGSHLQILVSPKSLSDDNGIKHEPVDIDPIRKAKIEQVVIEMFNKRNPHDKKEKK